MSRTKQRSRHSHLGNRTLSPRNGVNMIITTSCRHNQPHTRSAKDQVMGEITTVANPPTTAFLNPQHSSISKTNFYQPRHISPASKTAHPHNKNISTSYSKLTALGEREDGRKNHGTLCIAPKLQPDQSQDRKKS